jgi:hypothetical protein
MHATNTEHMTKDMPSRSQHAVMSDQSTEDKTSNAAGPSYPKSAKHVCAPACTHEGANKDVSVLAAARAIGARE